MKKIFIIAFLWAFAATSFAKGILGYDRTSWGMTPEQVVAAEGVRAKLLQTPEKFKNAHGLVKIPEVEVGSSKYAVTFLFDSSRKLIQTNLSSHEQSNALINEDDFKNLASLLTQKYGKPIYYEENNRAVWNLEGTSIQLSHLYTPGIMTQIVVMYVPSSRTQSDTKNL